MPKPTTVLTAEQSLEAQAIVAEQFKGRSLPQRFTNLAYGARRIKWWHVETSRAKAIARRFAKAGIACDILKGQYDYIRDIIIWVPAEADKLAAKAARSEELAASKLQQAQKVVSRAKTITLVSVPVPRTVAGRKDLPSRFTATGGVSTKVTITDTLTGNTTVVKRSDYHIVRTALANLFPEA